MLTNTQIRFEDMAIRYGEITAYGYLEQIERAASIVPSHMTGIPPEVRLANALSIQEQHANKNADVPAINHGRRSVG